MKFILTLILLFFLNSIYSQDVSYIEDMPSPYKVMEYFKLKNDDFTDEAAKEIVALQKMENLIKMVVKARDNKLITREEKKLSDSYMFTINQIQQDWRKKNAEFDKTDTLRLAVMISYYKSPEVDISYEKDIELLIGKKAEMIFWDSKRIYKEKIYSKFNTIAYIIVGILLILLFFFIRYLILRTKRCKRCKKTNTIIQIENKITGYGPSFIQNITYRNDHEGNKKRITNSVPATATYHLVTKKCQNCGNLTYEEYNVRIPD